MLIRFICTNIGNFGSLGNDGEADEAKLDGITGENLDTIASRAWYLVHFALLIVLSLASKWNYFNYAIFIKTQ